MLHKMACSNPTYHKAISGKKKDWLNGIFQGTKPIWFLGDLNLTSICLPQPRLPNRQQPRGHLLPPLANPKQAPSTPSNQGGGAHPHNTSIKQFRMINNRAWPVFLNVPIYMSLLNYLVSLPQEQQHNLSIINRVFYSHLPFLELPPEVNFTHNWQYPLDTSR